MKRVAVRAGTLKIGDKVLCGLRGQFEASVVYVEDNPKWPGSIVSESCTDDRNGAVRDDRRFLYFFWPDDDVTIEVE